jgi:hypothetical protein
MNPTLLNAPSGGGQSPPAPSEGERGAASGLMADLRAGGPADAPLAEGAIIGPRPRPRMSMQTLVTVLMIVASAASLWMMRRQGTSAGVKFDKVKLDLEPEKAGRPTPDQQRILAELARSAVVQQSPALPLPKNPFKLEEAPREPLVTTKTGAQPALPDRAEEIRNALALVDVNAVMDGPVPVARVNGRLVRVGDTVGDLFLVAAIHDRSVDLLVDNKVFTVSMGDRQGAPRFQPPGRMPGNIPFGPPRDPPRR